MCGKHDATTANTEDSECAYRNDEGSKRTTFELDPSNHREEAEERGGGRRMAAGEGKRMQRPYPIERFWPRSLDEQFYERRSRARPAERNAKREHEARLPPKQERRDKRECEESRRIPNAREGNEEFDPGKHLERMQECGHKGIRAREIIRIEMRDRDQEREGEACGKRKRTRDRAMYSSHDR
jgi:hypothetical protein